MITFGTRDETRSVPPTRDFDRADYERITDALIATDWNGVLAEERDVDEMYSKLSDYLNMLIDLFIPANRPARRRPIESEIANLLTRISRCPNEHEERLHSLQKKLARCNIRRRCLLEKEIAESSNAARFFGYASSRLKMKDDMSVLVSPSGTSVTDDGEKADLLCDLFEETYRIASPDLPTTTGVLQPHDIRLIDDVDVSEFSVYNALRSLKPKKSLNPDGIPALFFKRTAMGIAKPLSILFRLSLDAGKIPASFRTAHVAPVHKKGARSDPKNKRPVSLTSVMCKTLERIVCKEIMLNAENQGLISGRQFAYRKARSTNDCLLEFINETALDVNQGDG